MAAEACSETIARTDARRGSAQGMERRGPTWSRSRLQTSFTLRLVDLQAHTVDDPASLLASSKAIPQRGNAHRSAKDGQACSLASSDGESLCEGTLRFGDGFGRAAREQ